MTFWDFFLSAISILSTGIITYIPLKYDTNKKSVHNTFIVFAIIAVCSGIGATFNLWRENAKSDKERLTQEQKNEKQQKDFSDQLRGMRHSDSVELESTRKVLIDSMTSIYKGEELRRKKQLDSLQETRQRTLTIIDRERLVKKINDIIKQNNLPNNYPMTVNCPMGNEEARKYAREVYFFLKGKGYNLRYPHGSIGDGLIGSTVGNESKGFWIVYLKEMQYITIDVGAIGSRP